MREELDEATAHDAVMRISPEVLKTYANRIPDWHSMTWVQRFEACEHQPQQRQGSEPQQEQEQQSQQPQRSEVPPEPRPHLQPQPHSENSVLGQVGDALAKMGDALAKAMPKTEPMQVDSEPERRLEVREMDSAAKNAGVARGFLDEVEPLCRIAHDLLQKSEVRTLRGVVTASADADYKQTIGLYNEMCKPARTAIHDVQSAALALAQSAVAQERIYAKSAQRAEAERAKAAADAAGAGPAFEDDSWKLGCLLPLVDLPQIARTIATHILRLNMKLEKLKK